MNSTRIATGLEDCKPFPQFAPQKGACILGVHMGRLAISNLSSVRLKLSLPSIDSMRPSHTPHMNHSRNS